LEQIITPPDGGTIAIVMPSSLIFRRNYQTPCKSMSLSRSEFFRGGIAPNKSHLQVAFGIKNYADVTLLAAREAWLNYWG
jgi:hypothetical protein